MEWWIRVNILSRPKGRLFVALDKLLICWYIIVVMASNRELKLRLFAKDPHCYWCKRETILTNVPEIKGKPNPLMATIDHLVSRYHPERWVQKNEGEQRRVLACFECNNRRSKEETEQLPSHIRFKIGQGYSMNPRGKALFHQTVESVEEVYAKLQAEGIEIIRFDETTQAFESRPNNTVNLNPLVDKL